MGRLLAFPTTWGKAGKACRSFSQKFVNYGRKIFVTLGPDVMLSLVNAQCDKKTIMLIVVMLSVVMLCVVMLVVVAPSFDLLKS